ncbi:MAG: SH3 domain-containing protein, partial [Thermoguttaceae bacterium]
NRLNEWTMTVIHHVLEFLGRLWWVFVPLPPLIWLALLPLVRRRERCRRDPVYALAVSAWQRFRRTARRDEELAWRVYLADRLALCAEALTADTVTEALRARNVDADLIAEARRRFEEKDAAEYGKRPPAPSRGTHSLVRRLQKATLPLLLIAGLLIPLSASAADRADELFTLAMQMREDRPDEAQPLFIDAALQFEAAERFLNAGNSWFFAGENGRALANYRAAQCRSPFDRQLRESIEFLRANRADTFPPPAAPAGKLAAAWSRYGTWTPLLRVGSFVLAYLAAWAVFLTAQLTGRRVRRAVWVVLLAVTLVPLASLAQSCLRQAEGVVIEDAVARLGPGYAYDPAFEQPLHKATEFTWLETRDGWVRVRLPDDSEAWLRESECMKVE